MQQQGTPRLSSSGVYSGRRKAGSFGFRLSSSILKNKQRESHHPHRGNMNSNASLMNGRSHIHCPPKISHRLPPSGFPPNPKFPAKFLRARCALYTDLSRLGFSIRSEPISSNVISRCVSRKLSDSFETEDGPINQDVNMRANIVDILSRSNSILPHVTLATTILALVYPPSFTWFTSRYYAPALGFLMFAVGVNSNEKDFLEAFKRPAAILAGYIGQFVVKPLLGYVFGTLAVACFGLPTTAGAGIMLTSCVSGAQLSNYATFLTDPSMAPLSIVMTSLSTATAAFVTPLLSLLLIGKRLPVDVKGMISSILQIVIAPIVTGLLLNRLFPQICNAIRPFLPPLSVIVTSLCVGAPLAININAVMSPFGLTILLLVIAFHLSAFGAGYLLSGVVFRNAPDAKPLQRTLSYETGMQSSLLALALANKFFQDPVVGVPPAISVVVMSLLGFGFVMIWAKRK